MKILIDECLPDELKESVAAMGHECQTARRAGYGSKKNGELLALAEGQWAQASTKLTEARDGGTAEVAAVAGYGLAVVAFQRGDAKEFKQPALAALGLAPKARSAPLPCRAPNIPAPTSAPGTAGSPHAADHRRPMSPSSTRC